jgi:peptidyl-prolyl cis-trans isomerase D
MLAKFRKLSDNFFTKIILLLIVASFAFWGIGDMMNGSRKIDLVKVGDQAITADEYYIELQKLKANLGEFFSNDIVKKLNLFELTLQELIAKKLFALEAENLNIAISDELVKKIIADDEAFQNESDLFDAAIFNRKLKQMRINEQQLVEAIRGMAAEDILKKTVSLPPNFEEKYYQILFDAEYQKRKLLQFKVNDDLIGKLPVPTDEELKGYYEANMNKYNAPEYRRFEYIVLDKNVVNASIKISEEELRTQYLKKQKQYMTPEKRDIWHLLYDNKAHAEQAYGMLRAQASLEEVADKIPPINKDSMEFGFLTKNQFSINAPDVFNLAKSDFTSPIKTDFGWHIFQVRKIKPAFVPSFEDLRAQLEQELIQASRNEALQKMLEKIEDDISAGLNLKDIAKNINIDVNISELIDKAGKKSDNSLDFDPAIYKQMLQFIFSNKISKVSQPIELTNNSYIVASVIETVPSRPRILEEVRGFIMQDLEAQRRMQAMQLLAENIKIQLIKAEDVKQIEQILQDNKVGGFEQFIVSRDGVVQKNNADKTTTINPQIISNLFKSKKPLKVLEYVEQGDTMIGGVFVEVIQPTKAEYASKYKEFKLRIQKNYEKEILTQYLIGLQNKYPIIRDEKMIESINQRF